MTNIYDFRTEAEDVDGWTVQSTETRDGESVTMWSKFFGYQQTHQASDNEVTEELKTAIAQNITDLYTSLFRDETELSRQFSKDAHSWLEHSRKFLENAATGVRFPLLCAPSYPGNEVLYDYETVDSTGRANTNQWIEESQTPSVIIVRAEEGGLTVMIGHRSAI